MAEIVIQKVERFTSRIFYVQYTRDGAPRQVHTHAEDELGAALSVIKRGETDDQD